MVFLGPTLVAWIRAHTVEMVESGNNNIMTCDMHFKSCCIIILSLTHLSEGGQVPSQVDVHQQQQDAFLVSS